MNNQNPACQESWKKWQNAQFSKTQKNLLYVGADDSNHGADSKGEIILTTFSTKKEDGLVVHQHNRRDITATEYWLKEGRDYRFTIIPPKKDGSRDYYDPNKRYNLILIAPLVVKQYLLEKSALIKFEDLKIFFDGSMQGYHRRFVKNDFPDFPSLVVDNFNKKQRTTEGKLCPRIECPRVVKEADTLANFLCNIPQEELVKDPHFVPIDPQLILERERELRHYPTTNQAQ